MQVVKLALMASLHNWKQVKSFNNSVSLLSRNHKSSIHDLEEIQMVLQGQQRINCAWMDHVKNASLLGFHCFYGISLTITSQVHGSDNLSKTWYTETLYYIYSGYFCCISKSDSVSKWNMRHFTHKSLLSYCWSLQIDILRWSYPSSLGRYKSSDLLNKSSQFLGSLPAMISAADPRTTKPHFLLLQSLKQITIVKQR